MLLWGTLQRRVYYYRKFCTVEQLK